jgi:PAS domain S-box-containing protein
MMGFNAGEVLGTHFSRFFSESERSAEKPERLVRLASASGSADYVGHGVRKNCSHFTSHVTITALRDNNAVLLGFVSIVRDLSLKAPSDYSKARETSPVPVVHDALLVRDLNSRITFWSQGAQMLYQWTAKEALGHISHDLFRTTSPVPIEKITEHTQQSATWDGRLIQHRKDGSVVIVESHWEVQSDESGGVCAILQLDRDVSRDLTAYKRLGQSRQRLSEAFEHAVIGLALVAPDGRWIRINGTLASILGYAPDELIGSDLSQVTQNGEACLNEDERRALLDGKMDFHRTEKLYIRKNGESLWGAMTVSLVRDALAHPLYFIVQILDVTESRKAAQSLADQRSLLQAIVENIGHALFVVDTTGAVLFFNGIARDLFGDPGFIPLEKVPEVYGLYQEDQRTHFDYRDLPLWQVLNGASLAEGDIWVLNETTPKGAWIHVVTRPLLNSDDSLRGAIVVARDVTSERKMQIEMEWNRAQTATNARLSALGMLAGSIAHEISNPLAIIHAGATNVLEMAEKGGAPLSVIATNAGHLVHTAERIAKIIASLRHVSREGNSDTFGNAAIHQIIGHALELWGQRLTKASITLDCRPIDRSIEVRCREVQISQIMLNLLQNAFDAIETRDGKKIIIIEVSAKSSWLEVSVLDNGPGFTPEAKRQAMNPFFTTKPVGKGTGLGLSISNAIAVEHGGRIEISERDGQTCVSLLLPLLTKNE